MPRSPSPARRSREPASVDASPRVGDVHRRRVCARCGNTKLVTRMKITKRSSYHLFYALQVIRTDKHVEAWVCQPCTVNLQGYGILRA